MEISLLCQDQAEQTEKLDNSMGYKSNYLLLQMNETRYQTI